MVEIDQPVKEAGCDMPVASPTAAPTPAATETPPPSMSVNLNAQGMDNIEQMMRLFQKVNPDMMPKTDLPMPKMSNPAMMPKMDNPGMKLMGAKIDQMGKPEEAMDGNFSKATTEPDVDIKDISAAVPKGDDLHKSKKSYSDKPYRGDNPMAVEDIKKYLERRYREVKEG